MLIKAASLYEGYQSIKNFQNFYDEFRTVAVQSSLYLNMYIDLWPWLSTKLYCRHDLCLQLRVYYILYLSWRAHYPRPPTPIHLGGIKGGSKLWPISFEYASCSTFLYESNNGANNSINTNWWTLWISQVR